MKLDGDYSEICLVTDTDQQVGLIGFQTEDLGGSNKDYADRYRLDRTGESFTISERRDHRHMHADHSGGVAGMAGVHFRWGAGLRVRADQTLELFAAQRSFVGGRISSNTFDTK